MKIVANRICRVRYKLQKRIGKHIQIFPAWAVMFLAVAFFGIVGPNILEKGVQPELTQTQIPVEPQYVAPDLAKEVSEAQLSFEERHKDREYLFLLYDMSIEVNEDWSYKTTVHKRIKIFKESAKIMGEIPIQYEKGRDRIIDIEAFAVTPDGEKHNYSKMQEFKLYEGFGMYSDNRYKMITLPEVSIGSVLEYKFTIVSKGNVIKDTFWYDSYLGASVPVKKERVVITFPKSLNIKYKGFNVEYKPEIEETESTVTYVWKNEEKEGFRGRREDYLPPPTPDIIKNYVEFSSIKSWSDISDWYYSATQENLKINQRIKKTVEKILKGHTTKKDKVRAVLEYVQKNFRYVSMSFGKNALEPHPVNKTFRNKYGDCKDLSLLCMAMLKQVGIKSHMALFNSEYSITDPQYDLPIPSLFNHVLLLVEDTEEGDFYIDPLLDGYDIGQYPMSYQRAYTFVITEDGGRFERFPVFDEKRIYRRTKQTITINADGSAVSETKSLWSLDFSIKTRALFNNLSKKEKENVFQGLNAMEGEALERRWENIEQKYGPIESYLKFKQKDKYPVIDDMITIDISGSERMDSFEPKRRNNPIFYYKNALTENTTIYHVPKEFYVSHIPKNLDINAKFFSVKRKYSKKENRITISETRRSKRMELPVSDYKKIRDSFQQLHKQTNQRIVLKKIKPWRQEIKDIFLRFKR